MKNKTLRAFTLTEMIVVMLITVVILGMAYTVVQIVSKSYNAFTTKNSKVNDAERLEEWLLKDFQNAVSIYSEGNMIVLKYEADSTRYIFKDSVILRQRIKTDTFEIKSKDFAVSFLKRPTDTVGRKPIDDLNFNITLEGEEIPETFHKLYSSEQLMELTDAIDRYQQP